MNLTYLPDSKGVECRFCSLLNGAEDKFNSTWLSDDAYRAIVSVGSFVPGWSMVCPVSHHINLSDFYRRQDFWDFTSIAADAVSRRYGKFTMFEHGAGTESSLTGCGVGHAHGHLVPLDFSLENEALKVAPELNWQQCRAADIKALVRGGEYLFVASTFEAEQTVGRLCVLETPTSQFFRKVIANKLGIGELYDYKKYPMLEIAQTSASELRELSVVAALGA